MLDCPVFKSSFKGDLCTPTDADYAKAITRWGKNAERQAQIVAFVKDSEDIALAIAFARGNNLPLAIRGGGHSTAGASSSEGLVIDLSRHMNTVEIDADKKLAIVGGGATWADVDRAAIQHGLAAVGGTINHTGVGGLTLGGGFGWLSGKHGMVIDNLVQATVINSKREILTASETENPELFWGIRGGGCNFGVVSQFVYKLHPQRRTVYAGVVIYPFEVLEELVELTNKWWDSVGENEAMMQIISKAPQGPPVPVIVGAFFYNGSEVEGRENFKDFMAIKHLADFTKEMPYEELNGYQNHMVEYGSARLIKGAFQIKSDLPSIRKAAERVVAMSTEEHSVNAILELIPVGKIMAIPNGASAFVRSPANNITLVATWKNNTSDNLETARSMVRELADILADGQKAHFKVNRGYGNYDQDGGNGIEADPLSSKAEVLFAANYPRLQKLKHEHDPDNIFSKWFPIAPSSAT